eukprot:12148962-Alexandrium_andersonii.AAC.1
MPAARVLTPCGHALLSYGGRRGSLGAEQERACMSAPLRSRACAHTCVVLACARVHVARAFRAA